MKLLHSSYVTVTMAQASKEFFSLSANIRNGINKKFEELNKKNITRNTKTAKGTPIFRKGNRRATSVNQYQFWILQVPAWRDKRDCLEHKQVGAKVNGIYKIYQKIPKIIQVYCDQTTDSGVWTVFQRTIDGSVDFLHDWEYYKQGFGNLQNEFWLGNENIFTLTLQGLYPRGNELRIDMISPRKMKKSVKYANFHVTNAA